MSDPYEVTAYVAGVSFVAQMLIFLLQLFVIP